MTEKSVDYKRIARHYGLKNRLSKLSESCVHLADACNFCVEVLNMQKPPNKTEVLMSAGAVKLLLREVVYLLHGEEQIEKATELAINYEADKLGIKKEDDPSKVIAFPREFCGNEE